GIGLRGRCFVREPLRTRKASVLEVARPCPRGDRTNRQGIHLGSIRCCQFGLRVDRTPQFSSRRASTSRTSRATSGARPPKSPCQGFARTKQVPPDADLDIAADPRGVRSKKPRRSGAVGTFILQVQPL